MRKPCGVIAQVRPCTDREGRRTTSRFPEPTADGSGAQAKTGARRQGQRRGARTHPAAARAAAPGRPAGRLRPLLHPAAMAKALPAGMGAHQSARRISRVEGSAACVGACVRVCLCPLSQEHARWRVNVHYECVTPDAVRVAVLGGSMVHMIGGPANRDGSELQIASGRCLRRHVAQLVALG